MLLTSNSPMDVTAISTVKSIGLASSSFMGLFYLLVAVSGLLGVLNKRKEGLIFVLPQSFLLIVSAFGAAQAMVSGMFADGIIRPVAFLVVDQSPAIIAAILHSMNVLDLYFRRPK